MAVPEDQKSSEDQSLLRELAITERRRRLLATALEEVRQGVAITDARLEPPGPRLLFVNDYLCEISGYSAEELAGRSIWTLLAEEPESATLSRLEEELRAGRSFHGEFIHQRKDGTRYVASDHMSPVFGADGELTRLVSIQQDITERKRAEEALRRSEERYRLLIERMNEGFVATDQDNRIDLVNAKFVEMLGYSRDELRGRHLAEFVDDENREKLEAQEERRRRGVAETYEIVWSSKDGRKIDTVVSPTSLLDSDGSFVGSFAVITDVTERKRSEGERRALEERIQKAQKMESLGLLAGGVAHDFNNLLVGVLGNAGLALMELPPESPVHALVRRIETAALRASDLTREMLAYSGKGRTVAESIEMSSLVEEMAQLLRATISKKAEIRLDSAGRLPPIAGDPTQIRQVVMNLITNAAEALEEASGEIVIRTGEMLASREYLTETFMDDGLDPGRYVFVEVSDNGCGMDAETRSKIFDPFFTTKFTGRGLGLAAVLGIVRGHQGAIKVYSEVGLGTSFKVLFPPSGQPADSPTPPVAETPSLQGSGCVLVVDDEELVREVAKTSLESAGYSVLTANDGVEAVEIFGRDGDEIEAVLLDMTMPRMGGAEACREIRRVRPKAKIILASGFSEQEAIQRFAGESPDGFLQKPFQPKDVILKVQQVLGQAPRLATGC